MSPAKKRGSINLTALGSAAVMAVYAAGYLRTRAAAQRYESSDSQRRPAAPAAAAVKIDAAGLMDTLRADALRTDTLRPAVVAPPPVKKKTKVAPAIDMASSEKPDTAPVRTPKDTAPAPSAPLPPTPAPAVTDSVKPAADSVKILKDGTYTGWGTSRHGDIQAAVE